MNKSPAGGAEYTLTWGPGADGLYQRMTCHRSKRCSRSALPPRRADGELDDVRLARSLLEIGGSTELTAPGYESLVVRHEMRAKSEP